MVWTGVPVRLQMTNHLRSQSAGHENRADAGLYAALYLDSRCATAWFLQNDSTIQPMSSNTWPRHRA